MKRLFLSLLVLPLILPFAAMTGCTPLDKRVALIYEQVGAVRGGTGGVYLLPAIFPHPLQKVPAGSVLGTVRQTATQIVATGNVPDWIQVALTQELQAAGYTVTTVPEPPPRNGRSVQIRIERLAVNQSTETLIMVTSAEVGLQTDVWKNGSLARTLTVSAAAEDQGLDRSGVAVANTLQKTLQSAMQQLMPGLVDVLER